MSRKVLVGLVAIAIAAIAVTLWIIKRPNKTSTSTPIRIGVLKHESSLPVYMAEDLGYFKKHNVQVQLVELPPGDHMPALLADRVDILSPTSFPTLFGVMAEHPDLLYVVFPGAETTEGPTVYGLIVKSDFKGQTIKDLRGGVIMAINPFTKVNIQTILNSAGIPKENWPDIRVASREAALQAVGDGTATAAIMDQPALATAITSPGYRLLEANPRAKYIGSPYWSGAGAVKRDVWNAHKSDFDKIMAAIDEAVVAIRRDPRTAHQNLATRLGLQQGIADQIGGYYFPLSSEPVPKDGIEKTVEALRAAGLLNSAISLTNFFPPGVYGEK
jgi:NitT/TauT family transport system substrate-binding protein